MSGYQEQIPEAHPVDATPTEATETRVEGNSLMNMLLQIIQEIIYSPMNLVLVLIIAFLIYKILKDRFDVPLGSGIHKPSEPELPRLRRDFTLAELKQYDGRQPDGRVLIAVNGFVFDVSKAKRFYGPGGPYASFAGRDVTRNLATFSMAHDDTEEYDDLSDLSPMEMESIREWEMQYREKYFLVGKLLRRGEQPTNYEDEEDDTDRETNKMNDSSHEESSSMPEKTCEANSLVDEIQDCVLSKRTSKVTNNSATEEEDKTK